MGWLDSLFERRQALDPGILNAPQAPIHGQIKGGAGLLSHMNDIELSPQGDQPPPQAKNVFQQAVEQYPIIQQYGVKGKLSPGAREGYLEFWPPGETGPPEYPRPQEFGDAPGVEIYKEDTTPLDVLGDVTSHWLIEQDPRVRQYYQQFQQSLAPEQKERLRRQYEYAQQNFGETRPYDQWEEMSGLPGYFRGYAFQQWPEDFNQQAYSPEQRAMFDEMMQYLMGSK